MGRKRIGVWRKIARGDAGHKKAQADLSYVVYLAGMVTWLMTKIINHSEFFRFKGSPTELDDICFERMHKAMRLMFDARREVEWVANCSELECDRHDVEDKVQFGSGCVDQGIDDESLDDGSTDYEDDDVDELTKLTEDTVESTE